VNEDWNWIKVRDDYEPVKFKMDESVHEKNKFILAENMRADWCSEGIFYLTNLRDRVEPWLTSLFQSEHLSLLIGSGLTTAIQHKATGYITNAMDIPELITSFADKIRLAVNKSASCKNRGEPNIEDYIRVMNELLCGLNILQQHEEYNTLKKELDRILNEFAYKISHIEYMIATANEDKREASFANLVLFLMSFASRTGTRERLNIFTTNYDRIIEVGAELAGLHLLDRFVGSLTPVFRSSRLDIDMHYNPPGIRGEPRYLEGVVKFTKLHGSIDWVDNKGDIRKIGLPFGLCDITSFLSAPGLSYDISKIMVYPNASKDRETTEYPYVELFRDFASALCRPNSTLVTYGYGFGDDHINRIIRDMLTIPSTHLVVISYDDKYERIMKFYKDTGRVNQISLIIGKDIADIDPLTNYLLPKPSIDINTIKMTELLTKRYGQPNKPNEYEIDGGAEK